MRTRSTIASAPTATEDGAQRRFGSWLLARARESYYSFFRQSELIQDGIDIAHLRGYLRFAIDGNGDVPTAATIVGTLMHWWSALGLTSEGLRWIDAALAKLDSEGDDLRPRIVALIGKTSLLRSGLFLQRSECAGSRSACLRATTFRGRYPRTVSSSHARPSWHPKAPRSRVGMKRPKR